METVQLNEKLKKYKQQFKQMMKMYESIRDGYLERTTVTKHFTVLQPVYKLPIHSTPYLGDSNQKELECEEIDKMKKVSAAKCAETEWVLPAVCVRKKDGSLQFIVLYQYLNDVP